MEKEKASIELKKRVYYQVEKASIELKKRVYIELKKQISSWKSDYQVDKSSIILMLI